MSYKYKEIAPLAMLIYILIFVLAIIGWVMNIVKLIGMLGGDITAMFLARLVGLIPIVGAVLGWI